MSRVALAVMDDVPPAAAIVVGFALTLTTQLPYVVSTAPWVTVQVLLTPACVAVTVHERAAPVLLDAVSVLPLSENPAPLADNVGLAVSVPVFVPLVKMSRVALVVMDDVPPAAAILVGFALTLTVHSPYVIISALNLTSNVRAEVTLNV